MTYVEACKRGDLFPKTHLIMCYAADTYSLSLIVAQICLCLVVVVFAKFADMCVVVQA